MARKSTTGSFWPDGVRLVVSISMQFEAGGAPASGAPSPLDGFQMEPGFADYPTTTWYQYGVREGIPRLLDLFSALKIRTTSHVEYAQKKKGVAFMRKDEIAEIATKSQLTPRFESLYEN